MLSSGHLPSRRWLTLAVLPAFLGYLLQPQVNVLYHVHRGGDYQHIHARVQLSAHVSHDHPHQDHHSHNHHHHDHSSHRHPRDATIHHAHSHESVAPSRDRQPQIHRDHVPQNAHWHTTVVCHWVSLDYREPQSPTFPVHLFQQTAETIADVPLVLAFQPRAPPSLA